MEIRRVCDEVDFKALKAMAIQILEPLYGDQSKALQEWFSGEGYKFAFVLAAGQEIAGFLSLKVNPAKPYLKISTLMVFDGFRRLGYGKKLLDKAKGVSKELGFSHIKVTVSDVKQDSLNFFTKSGFVVVREEHGKYKADSVEFTLELEV